MKRARDPEEKAKRRAAILAAAWTLYADQDLTAISVAQIARHAGVAKGTVYLYFQTREEIFAELLDDHYARWLASIVARIPTSPTADQVAAAILGYLEDNNRFLSLACTGNAILEQNMSEDAAIRFKRNLDAGFRETALALSHQAGLEVELTGELLLQSYAVITGLWQIAEPPSHIRAILEREGIRSFTIDFTTVTHRALVRLWSEPVHASRGGTP